MRTFFFYSFRLIDSFFIEKEELLRKRDARGAFYAEFFYRSEIGAHECLANGSFIARFALIAGESYSFLQGYSCANTKGWLAGWLAGWLTGWLAEWIGARAGSRASDILPLSLDLSRFILHWTELAVYANCYS